MSKKPGKFRINHFDGLHIINSMTVHAKNISIENGSRAGCFVQISKDVIFDEVSTRNCGIGVYFSQSGPPSVANRDCQVINSAFINSTGLTHLFGQHIHGLKITNCSATSETGTVGPTSNFAQFGDVGLNSREIMVSNCIFSTSVINFITGLLFRGCTQFTVDSVQLLFGVSQLYGILIDLGSSCGIIKKYVIQSPTNTDVSLRIDNSSAILLEQCNMFAVELVNTQKNAMEDSICFDLALTDSSRNYFRKCTMANITLTNSSKNRIHYSLPNTITFPRK